MWTQVIDPFGNLALSALVAALPIIVFLALMVVFKLSGLVSGLIALVVEVGVALFVFGMPAGSVAGAGLSGLITALWPIAYIIVMAVWLYRLAVLSGRFDTIRASIAAISPDQRIQALLISFAFGAFLEGVAGFGVPIAICAALLVQLGFKPVKAAVISLVANVAAGAYGAIGIPVLVGAQVTGLDVAELSRAMVIILQPLTLLVPFLLVAMIDGWRGVRETFPIALVATLAFSGIQAGVLWFLGPELADIAAGLGAMVAIFMVTRAWTPQRVFRLDDAPAPTTEAPTFNEVVIAWSPFYILSGFILLWALPPVKALFATGALAFSSLSFPIPGVTGQITNAAGSVIETSQTISLLGATGTAILLAVIVSFLTTPQVSLRELLVELHRTVKSLGAAIALIAIILVLANIANYSGGSTSMGSALAAVGPIFPLIAPIIGWIGVFLTGSVVNNNTLFAPLQVATANGIGVTPGLLVGGNTAGGTTAKVISPQSIAIAAGAVGLSGREGEILRQAITPSLVLLALICVWNFVLALLI